jgi:hypothetical protein
VSDLRACAHIINEREYKEAMADLDTAYQTFLEPEQPRRKKKSRRVMLPPPEPQVIEPDRPAHRQLPPAELLGGSPTENITSTSQSALLNAYDVGSGYFAHPNEDIKDENVYNLEPDWAKTFNSSSAPDWIKSRFPDPEAESPLIPSPWLDGGATLWQNVSDNLRNQPDLKKAAQAADSRIDDLQRKLDSMFKKLDDLETTRAESNHLEIILFVLGGIFLLLLIDLLVRQGSHAQMLVTAAGGTLIGGRSRAVWKF